MPKGIGYNRVTRGKGIANGRGGGSSPSGRSNTSKRPPKQPASENVTLTSKIRVR